MLQGTPGWQAAHGWEEIFIFILWIILKLLCSVLLMPAPSGAGAGPRRTVSFLNVRGTHTLARSPGCRRVRAVQALACFVFARPTF